MTKNIVLIHSKPGLGKSTLAKSITSDLCANGIDAQYFSIGGRLYAVTNGEIKSQYYEAAQQYKSVLAQNGVIDEPSLIHGIFGEALVELGADVTVIDGHPMFPRLVEGFYERVASGELKLLVLIVLEGSDELAIQRMQARGREFFGVGEDPCARLALYKEQRQSVTQELEQRYGALHINATDELSVKTRIAVDAIKQALTE